MRTLDARSIASCGARRPSRHAPSQDASWYDGAPCRLPRAPVTHRRSALASSCPLWAGGVVTQRRRSECPRYQARVSAPAQEVYDGTRTHGSGLLFVCWLRDGCAIAYFSDGPKNLLLHQRLLSPTFTAENIPTSRSIAQEVRRPFAVRRGPRRGFELVDFSEGQIGTGTSQRSSQRGGRPGSRRDLAPDVSRAYRTRRVPQVGFGRGGHGGGWTARARGTWSLHLHRGNREEHRRIAPPLTRSNKGTTAVVIINKRSLGGSSEPRDSVWRSARIASWDRVIRAAQRLPVVSPPELIRASARLRPAGCEAHRCGPLQSGHARRPAFDRLARAPRPLRLCASWGRGRMATVYLGTT